MNITQFDDEVYDYRIILNYLEVQSMMNNNFKHFV